MICLPSQLLQWSVGIISDCEASRPAAGHHSSPFCFKYKISVCHPLQGPCRQDVSCLFYMALCKNLDLAFEKFEWGLQLNSTGPDPFQVVMYPIYLWSCNIHSSSNFPGGTANTTSYQIGMGQAYSLKVTNYNLTLKPGNIATLRTVGKTTNKNNLSQNLQVKSSHLNMYKPSMSINR